MKDKLIITLCGILCPVALAAIGYLCYVAYVLCQIVQQLR